MARVIGDLVLVDGLPADGISVTAWLVSRLGGAPALNTALPVGSPDAGPVVSGPTFGGKGAWALVLPDEGAYYVAAVDDDGVIAWDQEIGAVRFPTVAYQATAKYVVLNPDGSLGVSALGPGS